MLKKQHTCTNDYANKDNNQIIFSPKLGKLQNHISVFSEINSRTYGINRHLRN